MRRRGAGYRGRTATAIELDCALQPGATISPGAGCGQSVWIAKLSFLGRGLPEGDDFVHRSLGIPVAHVFDHSPRFVGAPSIVCDAERPQIVDHGALSL